MEAIVTQQLFLVRLSEAAERLRITPKMLSGSIRSGEIPLKVKHLGAKRIPHVFEHQLEAWMKEQACESA